MLLSCSCFVYLVRRFSWTRHTTGLGCSCSSLLGSQRLFTSMHGGLLHLLGCTGSWGRVLEQIYLDVQDVYICCSRDFINISRILGIP
ncbi:hypothetical protein LINGRAHAP2_LOCUS4122 [Linum grandiflorum]